MKPRVYLETSVIGYLTGRHSRNVVVSVHQDITRAWWATRRNDFDLFVSLLVLREARDGDPSAANKRLDAIRGLPVLDMDERVLFLATLISKEAHLPSNANDDALHIALASTHGMDYLLTWNCTHIANAEIRKHIDRACESVDADPPVICTPEELLGVYSHVEKPRHR